MSLGNGDAMFLVPGGSNHDAFVGGNNSVRILQPVSNSDFDVAAKFDSPVSQQYQGEGILVQQDSNTYMRFELSSNGSQTQLSAAIVSGGNQTQFSLANDRLSTGRSGCRCNAAGTTGRSVRRLTASITQQRAVSRKASQ